MLGLFHLADEVLWRVSKGDPSDHTLEPLLPARIRNPRQYLAAMAGERFWGPWIVDGSDVVFSSHSLLVEWIGQVPADLANAAERVSRLVGSLRHLSGQFHLPAVTRIVAIMPTWRGVVSEPWPRALSEARVRTSLIRCAAPFSVIPTAVGLAANDGPPAWSVFFLDALRAHDAQDWKMALLLAALAMETGVGEALDEWHEARLAMTPPPPGVIELPDKSGVMRPIDPVYDALAERTSFRLSLHERPLHLVGRSLLLTDKTTFDSVLRLYTTRNKIAHIGAPSPSDTKSFALTGADAGIAIQSAGRCLAFFGKKASGAVEPVDFVPVTSGEFEEHAAT